MFWVQVFCLLRKVYPYIFIMVNETDALISLSDLSLLFIEMQEISVYHFCILKLCQFIDELIDFLVSFLKFLFVCLFLYSTMSSANGDNFISYLSIWIHLFLFLLWLLSLGLSKLCWIIVVRVDILLLFLVLEEILSCFYHWKWSYLWVWPVWPLLYWRKFSLCPHSGKYFYHKWMLNLSKAFFCIIWSYAFYSIF